MKINVEIKVIKAGVIGNPIGHSKSPSIHNYWLDRYNIKGKYYRHITREKDLKSKIYELQEKGYAGFNVTIPHKVNIFDYISEPTSRAERIGAVNTLLFKGNEIMGDNTDGVGFINNLKDRVKGDMVKDSALILGAGGAARAVLDGLIEEGFRDIYIANRTVSRAESLIKSFESSPAKLHVLEWGDISNNLANLSLLVNTTSLGMVGQPELLLDLTHLSSKTLVNDIVYNPLKTRLLRESAHRGNPIIDGLGMLLHQAVPGFKSWFKREPRVTKILHTNIRQTLKKL